MMTKKETSELARLLKKIPEQNYWIPEGAFQALHKAVSMWATELVVLRNKNSEILLAKYHGNKFFENHWHIPGGYDRWSESIEETCSRIAMRELGVKVKYIKALDVYKWRKSEHPYGRPLSVYTLVKPKNKINETSEIKFFNVGRLPKPLVGPHKRFILKHFSGPKKT